MSKQLKNMRKLASLLKCNGLVMRTSVWASTLAGLCLLIMGLIGNGCTREVDLSLKSTPPQLIIEGVVGNTVEGPFVRLSFSQEFADQSAYTYLSDALVVLSDSSAEVYDTLAVRVDQAGRPYFPSRKIRAEIGHVYKLEVQVGDWQYTARSVMPDTVTFQGITLLAEAGQLNDKSIFSAVPKYMDQPGVKNFYRFEQYVNHKKDPGINVLNDNVGDGLMNERPIFTKDIDVHLGDTLTVVMIQITAPVYQYFYQLEQNQQDLGATPSNPTSNIMVTRLSGQLSAQAQILSQSQPRPQVLGYFSAEFRQYFTARIAE